MPSSDCESKKREPDEAWLEAAIDSYDVAARLLRPSPDSELSTSDAELYAAIATIQTAVSFLSIPTPV